MAEKKVTRRLAAIVATDMVGYSRLMQADETGTISRQRAHREDLIDPKIAEHHGRIVNTTGDGLIIEFGSAVEAVQCAVEVQREMAKREADTPQEQRIRYRVGINIGDIVIDGDDIQGDGVIIAARLETIAEPGGVCISRNVFNQIKNKLELGFKELGPQKVKNIVEPVPAYKVLLDLGDAGKVVAKKRIAWPRLRWAVGSVVAALLFVAAAGVTWWRPWAPDVEPARPARMNLPLPDKPSVAVLPFDDLSVGQRKSVLADGITEDIITNLARVHGLFVIARNSTFTYKGKPVKVQRVAEDLGVRYVVEGSVRREGNKLRVTVQLIDALSGHNMWARRYDRELKDIFKVQDEIAKTVATKLTGQLVWAEGGKRLTRNLEAYHLVLRATQERISSFSRAGHERAQRLAQRAIALDPNYAQALSELAANYVYSARYGFGSVSRKVSIARALKYARRAVSLDDSYPGGHLALALALQAKGNFEGAIAEFEKAIALQPSDANTLALSASALLFTGQFDKSIARVRAAMRLNPFHAWFYPFLLANAHYQKGDYKQAVVEAEKAVKLSPRNQPARRSLAIAYARVGRILEAKALIGELLKEDPRMSVSGMRLPFKNPAHMERIRVGLRKAGLPEYPAGQKKAPPLSIVVLPFSYLSGDKDDSYLADVVTDQLTTYLARIPGTFVIARNTAYTFKGRAVDVKRVGKDLGVRFLLEGTIQTAGDRLRVNAQLVDASTGAHLWAEMFDKKQGDRLQLQDEIVTRIARSLHLKFSAVAAARPERRPSGNPDADALALKCDTLLRRRATSINARREAVSLCHRALKIDPDNAVALANLSLIYGVRIVFGISKDRPGDIDRANKFAARAIAADPNHYLVHFAKAWAASAAGRHEETIAAAQRALDLNPSFVPAYTLLCASNLYVGKPKLAIVNAEKAMRLSPRDRILFVFHGFKGRGHFMLGQTDRAIASLRKSVAISPKYENSLIHLAAVLGATGREAEAREVLKSYVALKHARSRTIALWKQELRTKNPKYVATFKRLTEGLRKAGMPEN